MGELDKISSDYDKILKALAAIQEELKEVTTGIYGDSKNRAIGLMEKQAILENQIVDIWKELAKVKDVNDKQQLQIEAKNKLKDSWFGALKNSLTIIGAIVAIVSTLLGVYFFITGQLPADAIGIK